jgi:hypothetical protein
MPLQEKFFPTPSGTIGWEHDSTSRPLSVCQRNFPSLFRSPNLSFTLYFPGRHPGPLDMMLGFYSHIHRQQKG